MRIHRVLTLLNTYFYSCLAISPVPEFIQLQQLALLFFWRFKVSFNGLVEGYLKLTPQIYQLLELALSILQLLLAYNYLAPGEYSASKVEKYFKHAKAGVNHACSMASLFEAPGWDCLQRTRRMTL